MDLTKIPRTVKIHSLLFTHTHRCWNTWKHSKNFGEHVKESRNNERKKMESSGFDLAENNGADF